MVVEQLAEEGIDVIVSVHLAGAAVGRAIAAMRRPPRTADVDGMMWATAAAPLAIGHVPPRLLAGKVGLIAAWRDDSTLDAFLAGDQWGKILAGGYEARLAPMRAYGTWSALPELEAGQDNGEPDEPVAALTLGRLRLSQAPRFLRASAAAERPLLSQPGLLAAVGLARPPFLSTFSLWRTLADMRNYAYSPVGGHAHASRQHKAKPFHHESIFVRLRPYRSSGLWKGADPLAGLLQADQRATPASQE